MQDTYKSIKNRSEGFFKNKGSKFFAYAFPVQSEEEIKNILTEIKKEHHSAKHHCYAWRLGEEHLSYRVNDDGEPAYTAGKPILGQLESFGVTDTLIVVVRYFGGTLLGTAGLINAYRTAAANVLKKAEIITIVIEIIYRITYSYNEMNEVMRIINKENINIVNTEFEERCAVDISVRKSQSAEIEKLFGQYQGVSIEKK